MARAATVGGSNKVKITQNSKNDELEKVFKQLLKEGAAPFVFAITDTVNDEYKMLWIAQLKKVEFAKATEVQKRFLGWEDRDARIVRTGQAIKASILDEKGLAAGDILEGFTIAVARHDFPAYDGQEPVLNPESGKNVLVNGKEVYEHRELVEA